MKKITKLLITCSLLGSFVLASCSPNPENNVVQTQDRNIVSIKVKEGSIPDKIYVGEFDNAGIKLLISYSDDTSEEIDVTSAMLSQQYKTAINTPGVYTVEIFYRKQTISLKINIVPKDLTVNYYAYVDSNEYVLIDSQIVPYRHNAIEPEVINDFYFNGIHYYFKNWDTNSTDIRLDTNVYAQYEEVNYYTVSFFNGNGVLIDSQRVDQGQDALEPTEEMRDIDGFTFIGWDRSYLNIRKDISINGLYKKFTSSAVATEITLNDGKSIVVKKDYTGELLVTTNCTTTNPEELVWKSSNPDIVSVENGVITARDYGTVTISAENDYAKGACTIMVANFGSKENPLSIEETMAFLDKAQDLNAKVLEKTFIKAKVSLGRSYSGVSDKYRIYFKDYTDNFPSADMILDETLVLSSSSIDECTIVFEGWASKVNYRQYWVDYTPNGERECPIIYSIEYPDLQEVTNNDYQRIALSLSNTPDGYNLQLYVRPQSAVLSQPFSWTIENESIISIEALDEFATRVKVTPLSVGKTKLTMNYKEISYEYNLAVENFGTEENPLSVSEFMQFRRDYCNYYVNNLIVEGQVIKAGNRYVLGNDEDSFDFNSPSPLLLNSTTKISTNASFYDGYMYLNNVRILSSVGGREKATISVTPSQALAAAKLLEEYEVSYDYYEITGYVSYVTNDNKYIYLSDVQEELDEEPVKTESIVIYRLSNYYTEKVPVNTKIKIIMNLYFYNGTYYENNDIISVEILEYAPTTDIYVQSSLDVVVGESRQITITPIPSYHIVDDITYAWTDENQQFASIDENGFVTGLNEGTATLEITYQGITKSVLIKVYESSSLEYQLCTTSLDDYGVYLIRSADVIAQYVEGKSRIGYYTLEEGAEIRVMQFDAMCEWEIAKIAYNGETYYTIKNVGSGLYLGKGDNGVSYFNMAELWKIDLLEDGTFEITNLEKFNNGDYNPHLRYNPRVGFGCYHNRLGVTNNLYVKKASA